MRRDRALVRGVAAPAALAALLVALLASGCGGSTSRTVTRAASATATPTAAAATATPTAPPETPTPTPSPSPTPTATPATSALAVTGAPPAGTPFPPPPPMTTAPPPNDSGIARIVAPGLGVDDFIEITRVVNNVMQTPVDGSYAIGWYPEFGLPGTANNAVFSAHETWNHFRGPVYELHLATAGDEIDVDMADGTTYRYAVISRTRYSLATIPMGDIIWPKERPAGEQWITLMTCGGTIVYNGSGFGEYLDRDVVVAKRIQ